MMGIFIKRGNSDTDRHVKRKDNVNTHGEHHLQTKEHQKLPATHHKLGDRHGTDFSSEPSEGTNSVDTLI